MKSYHMFFTAGVLALLSVRPAMAQDPTSTESARSQIRETLRAFYFNLAHNDWEALTADILAAKVVAHRAPPEELLLAQREAPVCLGQRGPQLEQSTIVLTGEWAEIFVPHCGVTLAGGDGFRMIHFEQRWRFVAIHLYQEPLNLSTER